MGRKRFLALVMALSMLFTLMAPAFAFADGTIKVLFTDSKDWGNVNVHYWGNGESQRPGKAMTYTGITNDCGQKIYRAEIPAGVSILFNNGNDEQTVDITSGVVNNAWWYAKDDKDERGHFYVGSLQCSHPGTAAVEENRTEPTCTTPGSYDSVVYCSVCGAEISRETIVIPATHTLQPHEALAATCTTAGNIAYWSCDRCDKYFADENGTNERTAEEVFIAATGIHDPVADPRVDPTCTETGLTEGSHCSSCGAILVERQVIPATGVHDWDLENPNWHTPTQDSSGIWEADVTFTCKSCNNTRTEPASMVGTLSETIASCTGGGNLQATFRVVFGTGTFDKTIKWNETELDPAAHPATLEHIDAASATCVKEGTNECWYCSACNKYFSDETGGQEMAEGNRVIPINENAHNWDEGVVTTEPTCTDAGVRTYTCQNNPEHTKTESVEAPGHTLKHEDAVAATTTADGHVEGYTCSVCDKHFSDANAKHEIEAGSWVIPALAVTVVDYENGGFTASIPAGYFTSDETDHEPTVTSEAATIVFNSPAKTAIAGAAGENPVSLSVATSTNEGVMTVTTVFENPGEDAFATVTVPFALGQGMVPVVNLVVDGERTPVEVLDYSDNSVTFRAKHFSVYEVSQEEQLGSEIHIDKSYFPDEAFRNYVSDHVDGHIGDQTFEKDGYLSAEEIAAVKSIDIPYGCKDVTGITIFSAVEEITFVATYSAFPTLDVSSFKHLKFLGGYMNFDLTSIVFGPNNSSTLKKLFIDHFQGNSLDLSSLSALEELRLVQCPNLTSVDVSNCTNLVQIGVGCCDNVTSLDVSHNLQLEHLSVDYGALTTLDVSRNDKLTTLACNNNQLTSLDLSNNPLLERLDCSNNSLTDLNIDNNTKLWALKYAGNEFNTVSVSKETLKSLIVGTDTWFGVYPTLIAKEDTTIGPINIHTGDKVSFEEVYSTGLYDATHRNGKKLVITNSNSSTYYYVIAMGMGVNAQFSVFDDSAVQMDKANADNWSQIDLPSLVCSATSASGGSYAINGIALGINMVEASSENMTEGPLKEAVEAANVIAFDVYPQITLNTTDGDKSVDLSHSSALQNQSFSVTLPLGKEYANQEVTITHYNDNGTVADTWTLTADEQGYVQFTMTSFSIITVTRTGEPGYVAQVGNEQYETLSAAFEAVGSSEKTVVLLQDLGTVDDPISISISNSVFKGTFDLKGHTVYFGGFDISIDDCEIIITDTGDSAGTLYVKAVYPALQQRGGIAPNLQRRLTLTFKKVKVVADTVLFSSTQPSIVYINDGADIYCGGLWKVTNTIGHGSINGKVAVNMAGGLYKVHDGQCIRVDQSADGCVVSISGGHIESETSEVVREAYMTTISGGEVIGHGDKDHGNNCTKDIHNQAGGSNRRISISGGFFTEDFKKIGKKDTTFMLAEGYVSKLLTQGDHANWYAVVKAVAKITKNNEVTYYATLQSAVDAAVAGDTVTLLEDIDLADQVEITKSLTLDLSGKTVSNTSDIWNTSTGAWSLISVQGSGVEVTVTGDGSMIAKADDCYALDVRDGAELTIEDGTYNGNITAVYAYTGQVEIQGGTFQLQQLSAYNDARYMLNCLDASYTSEVSGFTVSGGTFVGFDPQDNAAEGTGTDFTAKGYVAIETETKGTFVVVEGYTVTFDTDGGIPGTIEEQRIAKDGLAEKPEDPTKDGYAFVGWYEEDADEPFDFEEPVTSNLVLIAKWVGAKYTYAIVLQDSIDIKFRVKELTPDTDPSDYSITYTYNDNGVTAQLTEMDVNTYTIASCAAKEMTDLAHVVVKYKDVIIKEADYSIQSYCLEVIRMKENSTDEKDKQLVAVCKAALDYGRYAQETFGYKTDDLANGGNDYNDTISATDIPNIPTSKEGTCTGIKKVTYSLVAVSRTEFRVYFTHEEGAKLEDYEFTVDGNSVNAVEASNNRYQVSITGIAAKDLDKPHTVKIQNITVNNETGITFVASPTAYMYAARNTVQGMVMKAFYCYHLAAKAVFE